MKRNIPQTVICLRPKTYITQKVAKSRYVNLQLLELLVAEQGREIEEGVVEERDVAFECRNGFSSNPGEDVLEVVVFACEEVAA